MSGLVALRTTLINIENRPLILHAWPLCSESMTSSATRLERKPPSTKQINSLDWNSGFFFRSLGDDSFNVTSRCHFFTRIR